MDHKLFPNMHILSVKPPSETNPWFKRREENTGTKYWSNFLKLVIIIDSWDILCQYNSSDVN